MEFPVHVYYLIQLRVDANGVALGSDGLPLLGPNGEALGADGKSFVVFRQL